MPTYLYECQQCHHEQEVTRSFNDFTPELSCDRCGGFLKLKITAPAVIYKAKGFYSTENRRGESDDKH